MTTSGHNANIITSMTNDEFANAIAQRMSGKLTNDTASAATLKIDRIETPVGLMFAIADENHLHALSYMDMDSQKMTTMLQTLCVATGHALALGTNSITNQVKAELDAWFVGDSRSFTVPLMFHATPFTQKVWQALINIPFAQLRSYRDIAHEVGSPKAVRAVGQANGANPFPIIVPCHRVVATGGALGGYSGGLWRKKQLLAVEQRFG